MIQADALRAGDLLLRPYRADDVDAFYEAVRASIPEVAPWLPWCHADYTRDEGALWIAAREEVWAAGLEYSFAIVEAGSGAFLGGIGFNHFNRIHNFANLGYWVRTGRAGRGIMSTAVRRAARFGFDALGLTRIEIVVDVQNAASQRVAEKVGAVREGVLHNRLMMHGRPRDAVMFALLPDAPPADSAT